MTKEERNRQLQKKLVEMKEFDQKTAGRDILYVAGVDEVGRGPLAGPVVAAAVVLPKDFSTPGIDDSKKLSEKKRIELDVEIRREALAIGIGMADNRKIDEINILEATKLAMREALFQADKSLFESAGEHLQHVIFDAVTLKDLDYPQTAVIKGDSKSLCVAAASIVAKVFRDSMMTEYAEKYPDYAFEKNKGYGTKAHYEGIKTAGICPIHRRSFLKNIIAGKEQ
ncbi:MAG: ribonuclease HII [Clostridia bacterium]|nr:ribonuclease HII [Clostridia bacterium]